MFVFAHPWLLALLPLPLVVRWLLPAHRETRAALQVPFLDRLARVSGRKVSEGAVVLRQPWWQQAVVWLCWALVVAALARPQWLEKPLVRELPTRDLLLAVDLSGSMETTDFTDASGQIVDRLTAVKQVLGDFLVRRKGDRVGLIFFGNAPFVQAPFTEDLQVCRQLLDEAQPRMAGPQTMLGDAIGLAINVFEKNSEVKSRVLILLTDGNDTGSQVPPARAAEIARDQGITIHTIAVGDPTAVGEQKMDEETLKTVASTTGGGYFRANDRVELEKVYQRLDELETRKVETLSHRPRRDLFHWPLAAMVVLSLLWQLAMTAKRAVALRGEHG